MERNLPEPGGRPLQETVWRRAGVDTWASLSGVRFWAITVVVGSGLTMMADPALMELAPWIEGALFLAFVLASVVILYSYHAAHAPITQRNEARKWIESASIDDVSKTIAALQSETVPYVVGEQSDMVFIEGQTREPEKIETSLRVLDLLPHVGGELALGATAYQIACAIENAVRSGMIAGVSVPSGWFTHGDLGKTTMQLLQLYGIVEIESVVIPPRRDSSFSAEQRRIAKLTDLGRLIVRRLQRATR